jgi:hypothetical protein
MILGRPFIDVARTSNIWKSKPPCPHAVPTAEPTYAMSLDADEPRVAKVVLSGIDSHNGRTIIKGLAIDLGSLEMDSWVFPNILYMVELNCIIGTLLFPL